VPEGWRWVKLGDLCDYGICKSVNPKEIPDNAWVLDLEDIEKDTANLNKVLVAYAVVYYGLDF